MRSLAFVAPWVAALASTLACKGPSTEKTISADPAPSCSCSCPPAAATPTTGGFLPLDLPKATAGSEVVTVLRVTLDAGGDMTVNGTPVADDTALVAHVPKGDLSNLSVVIEADAAVAYGKVIHLLDVLKRAGVSRISFGVSMLPSVAPPPPAAPPP
jgi:biopolymer transport protein ExbD